MKSDSNTVSEAPIKKDEPIWPLYDVAGLTAFISWKLMMCFQVVTFNPLGIESCSFDSLFIRGAFLLGASLIAALHLALKFETFQSVLVLPIQTPIRLAFVIPGFALCCFSLFSFALTLPIAIINLLWFAAGMGSTLVTLSWSERFTLFDRIPSFVSIGTSYLFASIVILFSVFFDDGQPFALFVEVFPFISCVFFFLACKRFDFPAENKKETNIHLLDCFGMNAFSSDISDKKTRDVLVQKFVFSLMYSAFFGYLCCLSISDPSVSIFMGCAAVGVGIMLAAITMLAAAKWSLMKTNNFLSLHVLSVVLLSFLICFGVWPSPFCFLGAILITAYTISLQLLGNYTSREYAITEPSRSHWESTMQELGDALGLLCGWQLALILKGFLPLEHEGYLIAALAAVTIGVIVDSCLFKQMKLVISPIPKEDTRNIEVITETGKLALAELLPQSQEITLQQIIDEISVEYKLTERQSEVFSYLARGRNVSFIKEKLTLSTPTVKSHTYNIYQKLDVHSHQELIDLVESWFNQAIDH